MKKYFSQFLRYVHMPSNLCKHATSGNVPLVHNFSLKILMTAFAHNIHFELLNALTSTVFYYMTKLIEKRVKFKKD